MVYSVRMRRLSERARLEGMLALRKALEGVRRGQVEAGEDALRASYADRPEPDDSTWWRRAEATREHNNNRDELPIAPLADSDLDVAKSLDRIADSIERVSAQLDSYHNERAEHLEAIEFLLREMVIGTIQPTGARPTVLGGVMEPSELERDSGITIVPDGYPLDVDTAVEVRSRFHDRWISGFSIAEAVDTPGRCRYRLTRRSDGIPLPILFEATDVRAVTVAFERQPATSLRSSRGESRTRT